MGIRDGSWTRRVGWIIARYYDSNVGRFVSVDPMGFGAGDTNLYVGNNSTNATDPSGEWINFAIGAGIGFVSDLGMQLWDNRGTDKGIDLTRLAISTGIGAISGGVGGALIKQGTGLAARTAINAGVGFNTGYYGKVLENGIKGNDLTDGAVVNGIGAGAGAAVGELLFAGAGAVWKSEGVQSALARATSVVGDVWNGAGQKASDSLRKWVIQQSRARQNGWTSETGAIDLGIIDERIFNPSRLLPSPVNPLSLNSRSILQSAIEDGRVSIGIPTNAEIRYVQSIRRKALQDLQDFYNVSPGQEGYGKIKGIDNPRNGARNFAFASGNINGNKMSVIKAFSGVENVGSFAQLRQTRKLTTSIVDKVDRVHDSEAEILEQILDMTNKSDKGTIRLYTERVTCRSCGNAIKEFLYEHRPGIDIEIVGGSRPGGLKN
jgi:hypothetical protein